MEVRDQLINAALSIEGKLVYKKLKNRYRIYCMKCQRYEYVSKEEFRQIQAAQVCPMCFQDVKPSRMQEHWMWRYICDDNFNGYVVDMTFRFGRKPKADIKHVLRYLGGDNIETRYIQNCMTSLSFDPKNDQWKIRKGKATPYLWRFYSLNQSRPISSKKEYIYTAFSDRGVMDKEVDEMTKSNQKRIFMKNLLSGKQMEFVIAFDLKSYDEVYKYRAYMKKNSPDPKKVLNVHYLDYLHRNNIKLRDFYDYWEQCKILGYKLDKPKDFQNRHYHYSETIKAKKDKLNEEAIKRRYKELIDKAYGSGKISIEPFKSGNEIRKCAKQLHNCIASIYLPYYAKGDTDLYHLDVEGIMTVAIEVSNNEVRQARIARNLKCPANLMKHIRKWCSENEFSIGDYL